MKIKKGWVTVEVGREEEGDKGSEKFMVPLSHLHHPLFGSLLDKAKEVYGYHSSGPLRIPCSVYEFIAVRLQIEQKHRRARSSFHLLPCSTCQCVYRCLRVSEQFIHICPGDEERIGGSVSLSEMRLSEMMG
ncbi:hypothetical protein ZIOFF_041209 [Zingiber officinale]|uniref:Uncharacterized protein n=1 Tax=Zingiber officinale TaxID=94328 RepID=A0A8J5G699_ZINOF|nr:hypothetical protein ZIOFF_041209 [Zingiber officinale]